MVSPLRKSFNRPFPNKFVGESPNNGEHEGVDTSNHVFGSFGRERKENSGSENKEQDENVEKHDGVHFEMNIYIYSQYFIH